MDDEVRLMPLSRALCALLIPWLAVFPVAAAPSRPLTIMAVGDLMMVNYGRDVPGWQDPGYPFAGVTRVLREADVVVGNLEAPMVDSGSPTPFKGAEAVRAGRDFVFRTPTRFAPSLADAGFTLVSLANNHIMDYQGEGLESTLEALAHSGVGTVGAGRSETEARTPHVVTRNGWRVGFLAYTDINPVSYWAAGDRPGTASGMDSFRDKMSAELQQLRPQVDILAVSIHWGQEYRCEPNPRQRELARFLIDHGADLIIGHHPHVLQRTEVYRGKPILYSLGNFVSYSARGPGRFSAIAVIDPAELPRVTFIPVVITDGRPQLVTEPELAQAIMVYLRPIGRS